MAISNQLISSPSIYLFAFQQQREFFSQRLLKPISSQWSTHKYDQILNHFYACQKIKLTSRFDNSNLVNSDNLVVRQRNNYQSDTNIQKFLGTIRTKENLELIDGEAYPNYIDESHIIYLKINRLNKNADQAIDVDKLALFNPKNCFSPRNIDTNLGQTVVISAVVGDSKNLPTEELKSLANNCLSSFAYLNNGLEKAILIDSNTIFRSHIFTYYLPENGDKYNQIIVCLFSSSEDQDKFHRHHQELAKFFLSLHKLTYVHKHSNSLLKLVCYQIGQLKYYLNTSSSEPITQVPSLNSFIDNDLSISDSNKIENPQQKKNFPKRNKRFIAVLN